MTVKNDALSTLVDIAAEAREQRDKALAELATLKAELSEVRVELGKLAAWEPLMEDAVDVVIVGPEGANEFPWWAIFKDDYRARQYCEWLRTNYCDTVDLQSTDGRLAESGVTFWNNGDGKVLPTQQKWPWDGVPERIGGDA